MLTALIVAARIAANPVSNVFQKQLAQRAADPLFIIGTTHALLTLACGAVLFLDSSWLQAPAAFWADILVAAALAVAGNVLLVHALKRGDLSALVSVFLGYRYFQERDVRKRLAGAAVMVAGAAIIVTFGQR